MVSIVLCPSAIVVFMLLSMLVLYMFSEFVNNCTSGVQREHRGRVVLIPSELLVAGAQSRVQGWRRKVLLGRDLPWVVS